MSQAYVRDLSGSRAEQGVETLLDGLPALLSTAASQYLNLLRRSSKLVEDLLPSGVLAGANDCCTVPTQDCPPRCIAEIGWEGCACEPQRATVTVKNTGTQARNFSFVAGSLGPAKVDVTPTAAPLAPGQAVTLQVLVPGNQGLKEGETYHGELLIRGAYEQCVKLRLRIAASALPHLELTQGEVPERITELKWYRHWQCTDPCAPARIADPAVDRPPTLATPANTAVAVLADAAPPAQAVAATGAPAGSVIKTASRVPARKKRG
jgi:hypothetical protein